MSITTLVKPFDHIAGCSLGTWTRESSIVAILDFIQSVNDSPLYNDFFPDMAKYWREFAMDLMSNPDDLDIDHYSDLVTDLCDQVLPVSCSFGWDDGEFRVQPFIDDCITKLSELATDENDNEINPWSDDFVYLVNDHGNVDCYEWRPVQDSCIQYEWSLVWSMV